MSDRGLPVADAHDASDYYDPARGRAVLMFLPQGQAVSSMPAHLRLEEYGTCRRILSDHASESELPLMRSALAELAGRGVSGVLLHPYDRASAALVVRNWLRPLELETSFATPHMEYIGLEVADDYHGFVRFLSPEIMLWESLATFADHSETRHHIDALHEALELGTAMSAHIDERIRDRRGTSALVINTLCDLARRAMVHEKRLTLQSLERSLGGKDQPRG